MKKAHSSILMLILVLSVTWVNPIYDQINGGKVVVSAGYNH